MIPRWTGPFRVTDTKTDFVYKMKSVILKQRMTVYANRLKFYHDPTQGIRAEIKDRVSHDGREARVVEQFLKTAKMDNSCKALTKCLGYEEPT
jgi:hypothetical protein